MFTIDYECDFVQCFCDHERMATKLGTSTTQREINDGYSYALLKHGPF
jgi:hypothetical protein